MAIVAIVGRPNVGKSSLFNRLVGRRESIVNDTPGITRDRLYGEVEWKNRNFIVIDTGGLLVNDPDPLMATMTKQISQAVTESDIVILVTDSRSGITGMDEDVAHMLRKFKKPVIVVANKIDDMVHDDLVYDAYALGFEDVVGISAMHNRNIAELLDMIVEDLPEEMEAESRDEICLAIIGRPNVGKSSLANYLAGQERSIVSDVPGTTRDSVDSVINTKGKNFRIIDTAGLRRQSRIKGDIEFYSKVRTLNSINRSQVVVLMLDGEELATEQDKKLAGLALEKGKSLVILVNKWDLLKKNPKLGDRIKNTVREELAFVGFAPLLFGSSHTGRGLDKLLDLVVSVYENRSSRINTNVLNRLVRDILAFHKMPSDRRGRPLKIFYCTQSGIEPPSFVFFVNFPEIVDTAFHRYMERELRKLANFEGVPLRLYWRPKK